MQGERLRLREFQCEPRTLLGGKRGFLAERESERGIVQLGGDEEIDVNAVVRARINKPSVFARVFHAGPDAAPEAFSRNRVNPVVIRTDRGEVDVARVRRID
jgi:hypothetical protein